MLNLIRNNPLFGKLTGINLVSKIGDKLFYTALLAAAASIQEANIAVMVVSVSETLPIFFNLISGGLADRTRNKSFYLVLTSIIRGLLYLSVFGLLFFESSLAIIMGIAALNFFSDLLGNFSSGLVAPFTKLLVADQDLEMAQSLTNTGSQLINITGNFLGSFLLTFFFMNDLALVNALLFFFVALGFFLIRKALNESEINLSRVSTKTSLVQTALQTLKKLYHQKKLFNDLLQLALMNGFFGGMTPIFVLFVTESQQIVYSTPMTISLFSIVTTGFVIGGNILSPRVWQNVKNRTMSNIAAGGMIICTAGLIAQNLLIVLVGNGIISFLSGLMAPRFSAMIVRIFPAESMGSIMSTVNGLLVVIPPITALLFPLLAMNSLLSAYLGILIYAFFIIIINSFLKIIPK
ncbi:MFS transporter [Enterococcus sp. LJL90]